MSSSKKYDSTPVNYSGRQSLALLLDQFSSAPGPVIPINDIIETISAINEDDGYSLNYNKGSDEIYIVEIVEAHGQFLFSFAGPTEYIKSLSKHIQWKLIMRKQPRSMLSALLNEYAKG
jgi:hypothetical protein